MFFHPDVRDSDLYELMAYSFISKFFIKSDSGHACMHEQMGDSSSSQIVFEKSEKVSPVTLSTISRPDGHLTNFSFIRGISYGDDTSKDIIVLIKQTEVHLIPFLVNVFIVKI
jgi:hypothetical protein